MMTLGWFCLKMLYLSISTSLGLGLFTISERHLCAKQCSDQCVSKPQRPNCGQSSILAPVSAFDAVFTQDLNENLSKCLWSLILGNTLNPEHFVHTQDRCEFVLLRYSVSQYIELENTNRKVWECRKFDAIVISEIIFIQ